MGPAQNPNRRRRNATVPMVPLPRAGRPGPPPEWPLGADIVTRAKLTVAEDKVDQLQWQLSEGRSVQGQLTRAQERVAELQAVVDVQYERELTLWAELWALPQAVQWDRLGWLREVGQYVRWKVLGESGDLNAAKEARQLSDRLGLSPLALLRLRWEIVDQPVAVARTGTAPADPAPADSEQAAAPVADMEARRARRARLS